MIKKRNKVILTIGVILLVSMTYFSCASKCVVEIDPDNYKAWIVNTDLFIKKECELNMKVIKLGVDSIKSIHDSRVFSTIEDYLFYRLESRSQLLKYINENIQVEYSVSVFEIYNQNTTSYILGIDDKKEMSLSLVDNRIVQNKTIDNFSESLFAETGKNKSKCFAEFSALPGTIWAFSKYSKESPEWTTYRISMSN